MKKFELKDADALGKSNYASANHVYFEDQVTKAQTELYEDGYLSDTSDIDGCVGAATLGAIERWENDKGICFYTRQEKYDREKQSISAGDVGSIESLGILGADGDDGTAQTSRLPKTDAPQKIDCKQFLFDKIHLGGDKTLDTIAQSGCLTCCAVNTLGHHGYTIDPSSLSKHIYGFGGYNPENSQIQWQGVYDALEKLTGVKWLCARYDGAGMDKIVESLDDYGVCIVEVETMRKTQHFVTAHGIRENGDVEIQDPGTGSHHAGADTLFGAPKNYEIAGVRVLRPV